MGPGCYLGIKSPSNQQNTLEIPNPNLIYSFFLWDVVVAEPFKVCSFDHSGVKWKDPGARGVRSPPCASPAQAFRLCPQGQEQGHGCLLCFEGSQPALGVGRFRGIKRQVWIIPIFVPSVAGQAQVIEIPYPAVVRRVPL